MLVEAPSADPQVRTLRAGWGLLLLASLARAYLVFVVSLAACASLPMVTGLSGAVVQSGSMEPHISVGDVVLSEALPVGTPPPLGRVITFPAPIGSARGGFVLHRLVGTNADGSLVTAGDANSDHDSTPLDRRDIVSQARLLVPGIGLPIFWLKTGALVPFGLLALVTAGALVIEGIAVRPSKPARPRSHPPLRPRPADRNKPLLAPGATSLALVALVTVSMLALSPLGASTAAFSARTGTAGNTWLAASAATKLAFATSPSSSTGGVPFATQPVVHVQDASGSTSYASTALVSLRITTPSGALLMCAPEHADYGVATFAGCAIDKPGDYTLTATAAGLDPAVSATFSIAAGPDFDLSFSLDPSDSTGGVQFTTQPTVTIRDAGGNTTSTTRLVSLSLTNAAGAVLSCTSRQAVAGVASFTDCAVDKVGEYTLTATSGALTTAVSAGFTVALGPDATLVFTTSPSDSTGGTVFATPPVVAIQDAGGNTTPATSPVSLRLATAAGAVLSCAPRNAVAGVATFPGCAVDRPGTYTVIASSGTLGSAVSSSFTVTAGPDAALVFSTQPSGSTGGVPFTTQPVVTVQDVAGNTTTGTGAVTLSLTTPAGAVLSCGPRDAVAGVATFVGCAINKPGSYTLTATSGTIDPAISTSVAIVAGPATKLAFSTSPSDSTGGIPSATQPVVAVEDAGGNTSTDTRQVTLILTNAAGALLTCAPVNAVDGVATFAGCKVDKPGTYSVTASAGALTPAVSASFVITVGPDAALAFTREPSGAASAVALGTQPVVAIMDAGGNTTAASRSIRLNLTTPVGAVLTCAPVNAVAGVATFAGCAIDKAGSYTLTATSGTLDSTISTSFAITPGPAAALGFGTSPADTVSNTAFAGQPVVNIRDAAGNTVTGSSAPVTLALTTPAGALLTCAPVNAVGGVATFAGCKVDKSGTYTLTASSGSLTTAVSQSFTITPGPATKLAFTTNPSGSTGGVPFATQPVVALRDAVGNTTGGTDQVALTLTSAAGATLVCTPVNAVAGVATFAGCKVDKPNSYTLTASSGALTTAVSGTFAIAVGPAAALAFTVQPSTPTVSDAAFSTQPAVAVRDAGGNMVTASSVQVTVNLTTPAGAILTCATVNAASGVATFAGCKVDKPGSYTLTASSGALATGASSSFTILSGPATKLTFTTSPSASTGGAVFPAQPVVAIQDANNHTTTATGTVTLALTSPAGEVLTCAAKAAVSGVATFANCKIDKVGTYTLTATSGVLTAAISASFTITVGPDAAVFAQAWPSGGAAGTPFATQPLLVIQDLGGNTTTSAASVSVRINSGTGVITCAAVNAVSGTATFSGCKLDRAGPFKLIGASGTLASTISPLFTITP